MVENLMGGIMLEYRKECQPEKKGAAVSKPFALLEASYCPCAARLAS